MQPRDNKSARVSALLVPAARELIGGSAMSPGASGQSQTAKAMPPIVISAVSTHQSTVPGLRLDIQQQMLPLPRGDHLQKLAIFQRLHGCVDLAKLGSQHVRDGHVGGEEI